MTPESRVKSILETMRKDAQEKQEQMLRAAEEKKTEQEASEYVFVSDTNTVPKIITKSFCETIREKPEAGTAIILRNPALESILFFYILKNAPEQFFMVYPALRKQGLPYFLAAGIFGSGLGTFLGRYTVLNPNVLSDEKKSCIALLVRFCWSARNGLIVFIYSMGVTIAVDLRINPKDASVSDQRFFSVLVPPSLAVFLLYTVWNAKPSSRSSLSMGAQFMDFFSRWLLYGSVVGVAIRHQPDRMPSLELAETLAASLATALVIGETLLSSRYKKYKKIPYTAILYLTALNFMYTITNDLFFKRPPLEGNEASGYSIEAITAMILMALQLLYSGVFLWRHSQQFIRNYQRDIASEDIMRIGPPRDAHATLIPLAHNDMITIPIVDEPRPLLLSQPLQRSRTASRDSSPETSPNPTTPPSPD